ncbi:hypothetical protein Vafri_2325, partial [Volvox africanus]
MHASHVSSAVLPRLLCDTYINTRDAPPSHSLTASISACTISTSWLTRSFFSSSVNAANAPSPLPPPGPRAPAPCGAIGMVDLRAAFFFLAASSSASEPNL